ncbi:FxLYD domain-containing protein [Bordetella holmesii]|uniref:Exported protein n=2 Tax=Bordetella holmesii TaxID=35814 RepID=A0ABN0S2C5_9BORD|nr:FxLYD domain-containing protein [Bordetella holmesii]AHV91816.1 putative exported protein [Bordetella holmesii ATCC 51541]AIT25732.1 putative exported protein [Bordetella holmesii 44057]EWM43092.1 putative exported protein [Bordetella holmesii 41130]EWM46298.1 putative exported protein [Bordetella holmesii 35009]EWM50457.1 putative exported protein [Bordetella holmesii 70147]
MTLFKKLSATTLLCLSTQVSAQSLPQGVSLGNLEASRDAQTGQTVITGTYGNQSQARIEHASVTFALFDAGGREIGRISTQSEAALLPGAVWHFRASTPLDVRRFSAISATAQ